MAIPKLSWDSPSIYSYAGISVQDSGHSAGLLDIPGASDMHMVNQSAL